MRRLAALIVVFALIVGADVSAGQSSGWFCPMHAEVTADAAGVCPKCGMALVLGNPYDTRDYAVEMRTRPGAVRAGTPFTLELAVTTPGDGKPVEHFEVVHDKPYHLFVISADMSEFQHVHPERAASGAWTLELTLPKSGYYWIVSDFVPTGGAPQFVSRPLITAGYEGDIVSDSARLTPDTAAAMTIADITASIAHDPTTLVAGEYGHLVFTFSDAKTGQPVTDLQPYLGAFGHTLIMSEDMRDAVHAHPTPADGSDVAAGRGGPQLIFEGYLPKPGVYRAWTQVLRGDRLSTFTHTFRVEDAFGR